MNNNDDEYINDE